MLDLLCCVAAIGVHIGSIHADVARGAPKLRNNNYGAYVMTKNNLVVGAFNNSLGKSSVYVAYNLKLSSYSKVIPSIIIGGVSGYPGANVFPLLVASVRIPIRNDVYMRVNYIPRIHFTLAHAVNLSLEIDF